MDWFRHLSVDGLVLTQADGDRVLDANPAAEALFGVSADRLRGQRLDHLCEPDDLGWLEELRQQLQGQGHLARVSARMRHPDGRARLCAVRVTAGPQNVQPVAGEPGAMRLWTFTPIQLRDSRHPLHLVMFDSLHESVLVLDDQLRVLAANRHAEQRLGRAAESMLGRAIDELAAPALHPDGRPRRRDETLAWHALQTGQPLSAQRATWRAPDGSVRRGDINLVPIDFQVPGLTRGLVVSMMDHTELLESERRLAESEQAMRKHTEAMAQMIEAAPGLVQAFRRSPDGSGRFIFASARCAELLGLDEQALVVEGRSIRPFIHPQDWPGFEAALAHSASTLQPLRHTMRYGHPTRGELSLEVRSMPTREPDGSVVWNGFVLDVTERVQAQEEVQRLNHDLSLRVAERTAELEARSRELQAKTQELESFTYSVSHDLKAPLRGIEGYSRLLLTEHAAQLDEEGRTFLHTIRDATRHMGELIDDLLAYSRIDRSRVALGTLDLRRCIQDVLAERSAELAAPGLRLTAADVADCQVVAEREGLMLALRNLLDNALKFSSHRSEARIDIGAKAERGLCTVWVRDNGLGFDMRYHDRIFEIFQRLQRSEDYPGTGVGLAIVRKAMERQSGRVWAESQPGAGATFFLELPAVQGASVR